MSFFNTQHIFVKNALQICWNEIMAAVFLVTFFVVIQLQFLLAIRKTFGEEIFQRTNIFSDTETSGSSLVETSGFWKTQKASRPNLTATTTWVALFLTILSGRQIISSWFFGSIEIFLLEQRQWMATSGFRLDDPARSETNCQAPVKGDRPNRPAVKLMAEWLSNSDNHELWSSSSVVWNADDIEWTLTISFLSVETIDKRDTSSGSHKRASAQIIHCQLPPYYFIHLKCPNTKWISNWQINNKRK